MFFKINVLKNLANFPGKYLYWSLFLIKLCALRPEDNDELAFLQRKQKECKENKIILLFTCLDQLATIPHRICTDLDNITDLDNVTVETIDTYNITYQERNHKKAETYPQFVIT